MIASRAVARLLAPILAFAALSSPALAQSPAEELDSQWVNLCAGASSGSGLADRCDEILNAGPGSPDRRSDAAVGNNLDTSAAAGRLATLETEDVERFEIGAWNVFFGAARSEVERDPSEFENGFESDTNTFQVGFDRRIGSAGALGASLSYADSETTFAERAGGIDSESWSILGFYNASFESGHGFDAYLGFGSNDYDLERRIDYTLVLDAGEPTETTVSIEGLATGSTEADRVLAGASWAYDFGGGGAWSLGPRVGIDYSDTDIDGYEETDDVGLALAYDSQSITSLRGRAGLEAVGAISRRWGVISPQIRAAYVHEFDDDERTISSRFVGDSGNTEIAINTLEPDRDWVDMGAGLSFLLENDVVLFVDVGVRLAHEFLDDHSVAIGLRLPVGG
jgi:outer membrane autotransporter protein